mgnify:CR=1 FL=1
MKKKVNSEIKLKDKIQAFDRLIENLSKAILEDKIKCVQ